jgi:hypothetical protein
MDDSGKMTFMSSVTCQWAAFGLLHKMNSGATKFKAFVILNPNNPMDRNEPADLINLQCFMLYVLADA